jgi:cytidylate kinase
MVSLQRQAAADGDWVVEGRDIGTVVFPDAEVKVFLTASVQERARRRTGDFTEAGLSCEAEEIARTLERRDRIDSTRAEAPLAKADDATEVDTTELGIDEVVELIVAMTERS